MTSFDGKMVMIHTMITHTYLPQLSLRAHKLQRKVDRTTLLDIRQMLLNEPEFVFVLQSKLILDHLILYVWWMAIVKKTRNLRELVGHDTDRRIL
jgi:hypothetical protein